MSIKLASSLIDALRATLVETRRRMHPRQTLEHFLYVVVRDGAATSLLDSCGCDSAHLRTELAEYLELQSEVPAKSLATPKADGALERTLQRAGLHALSASQTQLDIGQVLVQILREEQSYAAMLLRAEGVDHLELTRCLSHGQPGPFPRQAMGLAPDQRATVTLHNDDYTPIGFVVFVLRTIFGHPEVAAVFLTKQIHEHGRAPAGVYLAAIAEDKVAQVHEQAAQAGFPLFCTCESA
jgi:ATP-dependent Clp protease adapter protein ClpS